MRTRPTLTWTPSGDAVPTTESLAELTRVVAAGRVAVLTGAGLSTESGIPDYRGESGSLRRHTPMTYEQFVRSVDGRRRYWARSHLGWRGITTATPNAGHRALAALQAAGHLTGIITQNVDGLHQAAGARAVTELHGSLSRVICLDCRRISDRTELERRLRAANPDFTATAGAINPDGDVELAEPQVRRFRLVDCLACGAGVLKPDVVFFGEAVPRDRVDRCHRLVDAADALLVLGSSLAVMSGLRFVRHAGKRGIPIVIVNRGATRGDPLAAVRIDRPLGAALTELAAGLGCAPNRAPRRPELRA